MSDNLELFSLGSNKSDESYTEHLPNVKSIQQLPYPINEWDIPSTIKELSYLVHSDYRYYGKFPSVVAGQILNQLPPPTNEHYILDNFCGSGTSLVEAKLRGIKSYGVDISWLSVLASNVKGRVNDIAAIRNELSRLIQWFELNHSQFNPPDDKYCTKWFTSESARDLAAIQNYLSELEQSKLKDFLLVAFIGIVRRVSKAFDGEVRPHINKEKRERNVLAAFSKKVNDMCKNHLDYINELPSDIKAQCYLSDNTDLGDKFTDGNCYLVISHPPYLNSFNYAQVFSMEFYWGQPFEESYTKGLERFYKQEMKAHPANESITDRYFNHLRKCYEETHRIQESGGFLAVVIGDCTRKGELIPVIDKTIEIVNDIGYETYELNYRTTHYGLGKYAYRHRADYHGDSNEKKDAIIIFRKK